MRSNRGLHAVIGAMGLAIIVLSWLYVTTNHQSTTNTATIRRLAASAAAAQRDARELRSLVLALQAQVRECRRHPHRCGPPLTQPPTTRTPPGTTAPPTGSPSGVSSSPSPTPRPRPTRTPTPAPTPHPSVSPSPSPSPSRICLTQRVCVGQVLGVR